MKVAVDCSPKTASFLVYEQEEFARNSKRRKTVPGHNPEYLHCRRETRSPDVVLEKILAAPPGAMQPHQSLVLQVLPSVLHHLVTQIEEQPVEMTDCLRDWDWDWD
jgi:hypothetical protein